MPLERLRSGLSASARPLVTAANHAAPLQKASHKPILLPLVASLFSPFSSPSPLFVPSGNCRQTHQCSLPFYRRSVLSPSVRTEELRREAHAHSLSLPRRSSHPELKHIVNASAAPNLSGYPVVVIIIAAP
ncbi:hypothetical protein MY10362_003164 [Beauveria mimosiformis]